MPTNTDDRPRSSGQSKKGRDNTSDNGPVALAIRALPGRESAEELFKSMTAEMRHWVETLTPVLDIYGYDSHEIVSLVKRCDQDAQKIQDAVDGIFREMAGREEMEWKTASTNKRPAGPKSPGARRGQQRGGRGQRGVARGGANNNTRGSRLSGGSQRAGAGGTAGTTARGNNSNRQQQIVEQKLQEKESKPAVQQPPQQPTTVEELGRQKKTWASMVAAKEGESNPQPQQQQQQQQSQQSQQQQQQSQQPEESSTEKTSDVVVPFSPDVLLPRGSPSAQTIVFGKQNAKKPPLRFGKEESVAPIPHSIIGDPPQPPQQPSRQPKPAQHPPPQQPSHLPPLSAQDNTFERNAPQFERNAPQFERNAPQFERNAQQFERNAQQQQQQQATQHPFAAQQHLGAYYSGTAPASLSTTKIGFRPPATTASRHTNFDYVGTAGFEPTRAAAAAAAGRYYSNYDGYLPPLINDYHTAAGAAPYAAAGYGFGNTAAATTYPTGGADDLTNSTRFNNYVQFTRQAAPFGQPIYAHQHLQQQRIPQQQQHPQAEFNKGEQPNAFWGSAMYNGRPRYHPAGGAAGTGAAAAAAGGGASTATTTATADQQQQPRYHVDETATPQQNVYPLYPGQRVMDRQQQQRQF